MKFMTDSIMGKSEALLRGAAIRTMRFGFCAAVLVLSIAAVSTNAHLAPQAPATKPPLEARRQALNAVIAGEWDYEMRADPETATAYGDYRYNDKLTDLSISQEQRNRQAAVDFLAKLKAIDTDGFPEGDQINKTLLVGRLTLQIEDIDLKNYEMPVNQFDGVQIFYPQLQSIAPLDTTQHYDDYVARLHQIPRALGQVIALLQAGERDGLLPPKYLLEKTVTQCQDIAAAPGETNVFALPVTKFPAAIPPPDQKRLHDQIVAAVDTEVRPAYTKLAAFVRDEYAPKGRKDPGLWALPDGDARYRAAVRRLTTTDMTPEAIHQLGLAQLKEIEAKMNVLATQQGFADWKAYDTALKKDPQMLATSREQILDQYRAYLAAVEPKLPELFGVLPKAKLTVAAVEEFREKGAAAGSYRTGTPDGSRPGRVMVNTGDYQHTLLPQAEDIAYHEGEPGHHLQRSIQQETPGLPPFRQHAGYTAYTEGWGLYAEELGKEMGFYQKPENDFERLAADQFRATRLVLDTGVHYKRWTRDQMVAFFHEHSTETDYNIEAETDRYVAYPAQALTYKIGQLKFLELRKRAQDQLSSRFDIRAFHDEMLNAGALPLDVLDARTNAWIASLK
jgi:uncharacterized protein (DUF885 family)